MEYFVAFICVVLAARIYFAVIRLLKGAKPIIYYNADHDFIGVILNAIILAVGLAHLLTNWFIG